MLGFRSTINPRLRKVDETRGEVWRVDLGMGVGASTQLHLRASSSQLHTPQQPGASSF